MKKLVVAIPSGKERFRILCAIKDAAGEAAGRLNEEIQVCTPDDKAASKSAFDEMLNEISQADVVIVDLSLDKPTITYELGFAQGKGKAIILISQEFSERPLDAALFPTMIYDTTRLDKSFKGKLVTRIVEIIRNPDRFTLPRTHFDDNSARRPTVFISYSHADQQCLERLQVHLRPLERENQIKLWDDTRIVAGARWRAEIEEALERAAIAVLLVSADFLASDFVVDNELPPLLKAAEEKGTTILPIVLKHCRFTRDRNLAVFQAINDPRNPLLSMTEGEQEELWSRLAERVENELNTDG